MLELQFVLFLNSMFLLFVHYFFSTKKKMGKDADCPLQVFQLSHVFLTAISIYCAMINYVYI
jgi:hypothetical protein